MQSVRDKRLASRLHRYNALLDHRHDRPTRTIVVLLRPEADGPNLTGAYRRGVPDSPDHLVFQYEVICVWQEPVTSFLKGGLGTIPLAPVADLAGQPIEEIIASIGERIERIPPALGDLIWASTSLLRLRYSSEVVAHLLRGVPHMEESTVCQAIRALGEARGEARGKIIATRQLFLHLAERRFGPPSAAVREILSGMTRLEELEQLYELLIDISVTT